MTSRFRRTVLAAAPVAATFATFPAVAFAETTAIFDAPILTVTGDEDANDIVVFADGFLQVTDGGTPVPIEIVQGIPLAPFRSPRVHECSCLVRGAMTFSGLPGRLAKERA